MANKNLLPSPSSLLFIRTQIQWNAAAAAGTIFLGAVCEFSRSWELSFVLEPPSQVVDRPNAAFVTPASGAGWALDT